MEFPLEMFLVFLLALLIASISAGLTKWLVDTEEVERKQRLIKEHEERKEEIIDLADVNPSRYRKERKRWERKDVMLKKTQQSMSMSRLKPTCIMCVPMLVAFGIIRLLFTGGMAMTAMDASWVPMIGDMLYISDGWINFTAWYFLCSLGMNTLIQRLAGIQTQASGGMDQMMGGSKAKALEFPEI
ncbi:MAG: DUF106 domain-containing protein [Promethearchaeota archaeon]|nr:MAG: DUF106 domain-containing protein [Candidatus Lokiarchaeota archaeon]